MNIADSVNAELAGISTEEGRLKFISEFSAANPAAILALIEQHEAAHSELLATRDDNHSMMLEIHNLRIERDELLAVLKSIDDAAKTSQSIIGFAGKLMGMLKQARAAIANAEKQS